MATRRRSSTRRRRNPARTTGMILVNPRRKRRSTKRRSTAKRRTARRRNPVRKRRTTKRRTTRRRNPVARRRTRRTTRRRNPTRRRRTTARRRPVRRRRNSSGGGAPVVVRRRRNPRRRRASSRRRNPSRRRRTTRRRRRNPQTGIARMFKKLPVIGPVLANAVGLGTYSVFGALSIEPVMALVKLASPWLPNVPASAFYAGAGLLAAALVPFLPFFSKATKEKIALSMASAAGGVAYYKFRTGQDIEVATEAAVVEMAGAGFGGLIPGPTSGLYSPPNPIDAAYSGGGGVWQVAGGQGGAY